MRAIVDCARIVPEPSGAVSSAALLFHAAQLPPTKMPSLSSAAATSIPLLLAQVLTETGM